MDTHCNDSKKTTPPDGCMDAHWWEIEQSNARVLARRPELTLKDGERYAGRLHRGYDYPIDLNRMHELQDKGMQCTNCEGHGHYNLRLSVLCGYHWAVCWRCAGYGMVDA